MKKLVSIIATFLLTVIAVQNVSAKDTPITFEQLPAKAQAFVKQHFKVGDIAIGMERRRFPRPRLQSVF